MDERKGQTSRKGGTQSFGLRDFPTTAELPDSRSIEIVLTSMFQSILWLLCVSVSQSETELSDYTEISRAAACLD